VWFLNLLYVNNFNFGYKENCLGVTWYLPNDMQFFVFSLIIFVIFNKNRMIRNIIILITLIGNIIGTIYISMDLKLVFGDFVHGGENMMMGPVFMEWYYIKPWTRIGPYLIGILFAELYFEILQKPETNQNTNTENTSISKPEINNEKEDLGFFKKLNLTIMNNSYIGFSLLVLGLILVNFPIWIYYLPNSLDDPITNTFINALLITLNKLLFILGLAIILHITYLNYFSIIKRFLGNPVFTVVARVTYGVYILHMFTIILTVLNFNTNIYFKYSDLVFLGLGIFVWNIPFSMFVTSLVESPVNNLIKKFLE